MNEDQKMTKVPASLEKELCKVDDKQLPEILSQEMTTIEKINKSYENAKIKQTESAQKVAEAVKHADEFVKKAKTLGSAKLGTHKILWHEYSTPKSLYMNLHYYFPSLCLP